MRRNTLGLVRSGIIAVQSKVHSQPQNRSAKRYVANRKTLVTNVRDCPIHMGVDSEHRFPNRPVIQATDIRRAMETKGAARIHFQSHVHGRSIVFAASLQDLDARTVPEGSLLCAYPIVIDVEVIEG